jgi:outer membrane protein insertion porin family
MQAFCRDAGRERFPRVRTETVRLPILVILCGLCWLFVAGQGQNSCAQQPGADEVVLPSEPVIAIRIEGNNTIPTGPIMDYVNTRIDTVPNIVQIREDTKALYGTRWFFSVTPVYRTTDDGLVLVYRVRERPIVQRVEYRGNQFITATKLGDLTGLKPGSAYSVSMNLEAAKRIEQLYHQEGFGIATVKLAKRHDERDREVVFIIKEGPRVTGMGFRD